MNQVKQNAFVFLVCVAVAVSSFFLKSHFEKEGAVLTQEAEVLSVVGDQYKAKADAKSFELKKIELKIKAKDLEIADLKARALDVDSMMLTIEAQEQSIALRDEAIGSLKIENKELRSSLEYKEKAYLIQIEATKAYQQAVYEAKIKSGITGFAAGAVLGFVLSK